LPADRRDQHCVASQAVTQLATKICIAGRGPILSGVSRGRNHPTFRSSNTKFDLIINMKTAKTLGLTMPSTLLAVATVVIDRDADAAVHGPRATNAEAATNDRRPYHGEASACA
jgi:hypothetical protein